MHTYAQAFLDVNDWFADLWLKENCPDCQRADIKGHYILGIKCTVSGTDVTPEVLYGVALIMAQEIKYHRKPNQTVNWLMHSSP
jgi:hypothetical protein